MHVISRKRLARFAKEHVDAARPLEQWYRTLRRARWQNLAEARLVYVKADAVAVASGRTVTVFNIGGNKYRLIAAIHYNRQRVYVLRVLTHAEYSKAHWKEDL
jgi:mRNA interferase HigB